LLLKYTANIFTVIDIVFSYQDMLRMNMDTYLVRDNKMSVTFSPE